ncbi:hypothetical protein ADK67_35015 [Saccharothrix sp. NRRL B-16348]|uniref:hypothetical protein n=1 Tax=Saccharothrix sp. NRRL B-16348 TaxID=1415542 RepID=UPI0006ADF6B6|nr:hypothetical protein [Saccharothrix sp. NRRL B-16348]KOX18769.1 hypothetical protein ADK67_35015 [Saccharothrix sp. NRRL B-16348]
MHDDPELIAMVRDAHTRGVGHEDVFAMLGGRGVSKSAAIVYYAKGAGLPDDQARRLVEGSMLWVPRAEDDPSGFEQIWSMWALLEPVDEAALEDPGDDVDLQRQARARAHLVDVAALLPDEALAPYREHMADGLHYAAFAALVTAAREHGLSDGGWGGLEAVAEQLHLHEWLDDIGDDQEAQRDFPELKGALDAARHLRARHFRAR